MESRIQDSLGVRSFGMIRTRITCDPSDLGSLILIRIIPKERTFGFPYMGRVLDLSPLTAF